MICGTIGLGHIPASCDPAALETASGYERALEASSIGTQEVAELLLAKSGMPHYKIRHRYYAPCAGDTSVFLLPNEFSRQARSLRDLLCEQAGDLVVHDRYPNHFHVTLRGFGTMPVLEGDPALVAARSAHEPAFRDALSRVLADGSFSNTYRLQPHDVALLGEESVIAAVIRHCPADDESAEGLQRLFRAFEDVAPEIKDQPHATWHTTLAYRLAKPFTGEEATRLSNCLAGLSQKAADLPEFELSLSDLVYWVFSDMDDFHEVGESPMRG